MNRAVSAAPEVLESSPVQDREVAESPGETRSAQSIVPLVLGGLAWLVVTVLAILLAWLLARHSSGVVDIRPLRDAALAVRSGQPIYNVGGFVYPPTAALFALPLTLVSFRTAVVAFSYLQVAIVLLTLVLVMPYTLPRSRWTLLVSAVIAAGFIGGDIGFGALKEENATLLLLLPLALVIICWGSGRWNRGALILVVTLLVKPLLLPLLLVPIPARRWTATALSLGLTTIGVALAFPLARSGSAELDVIKSLSQGSGLTGASSRFNLSLWGLGQWRHLPGGLVLTARIAVAVVAIACIVAVWRSRPEMTLAIVGPLAGILLAATFLAGPLSEVHYLLLLMPPALTCLLVRRNFVTGLLIAAWLLAAYSSKLALGFGYNISAWQLRFVGIEVLVFAACALALLSAVRGGPVDDSSDQRRRSLARATLGPGDVRGDPQARP